MRPTSRGYLKLKSKDPNAHPVIQPNYLSTEIDRWEMRESIKLSREIFAQKAFDEYRDIETEPGDDATTDEQLDAFVREKSDSAYHPSCTCKMGDPDKDPMAVVDSSAKVAGKKKRELCTFMAASIIHDSSLFSGLENLRVVDASIMPSVASGNLNAPTIMIAERAADIIRGKTPLPPANVPVYQPPTLETRR